MAKLNIKEIQQVAKSIILSKRGGIRYSALMNEISRQAPETPKNTISGAVWNLQAIFPNEVSKPTRGLFVATSQNENEAAELHPTQIAAWKREAVEKLAKVFDERGSDRPRSAFGGRTPDEVYATQVNQEKLAA